MIRTSYYPSFRGIITYVIYRNPLDYPGKFVLRKWIGANPFEDPEAVCNEIHECHNLLPSTCKKLPPDPNDDPVIYEVWM